MVASNLALRKRSFIRLLRDLQICSRPLNRFRLHWYRFDGWKHRHALGSVHDLLVHQELSTLQECRLGMPVSETNQAPQHRERHEEHDYQCPPGNPNISRTPSN